MAIISVHGILSNGYLAGIGGSGRGAISVTSEQVINEIVQYGILTFLLQAILLYKVENAKPNIWFINTGCLVIVLFFLLNSGLNMVLADTGKQDAVYCSFLPAGLNCATIILALVYKTRSNILAAFLIVIMIVTFVPAIWLLKNSGCPYWRYNGRQLSYYPNHNRFQEYTLECGSYRGDKIVWYENGKMKSFEHYNNQGIKDSAAEFFENGNRVTLPTDKNTDSGHIYVDYSESGHPLHYKRTFDSIADGQKCHFEQEILYYKDGNQYHTILRNFTTNVQVYARYYRNGRVNYTGKQYLKAEKSKILYGRFVSLIGTWYKFDSLGHKTDSVAMNDSVQAWPNYW